MKKQSEKPVEQVLKELTDNRAKLVIIANEHKAKFEEVYNEIGIITEAIRSLSILYPQPFEGNLSATMDKKTQQWKVSPLKEGKESTSKIIRWRKLVIKFLRDNTDKKHSSTDIFNGIVTWEVTDKEKTNQSISLSNSLRKMRDNETVRFDQLPNKEYRYYL